MTQSYFNGKAEIWDEKIAEKDGTRLENMIKRLDIQAGATVLDVGTGTGVFVPFLLMKIGNTGKLVCLDFAEKMLDKARAKHFEGNIEYVCGDISNTQLGNGVFDAVVCYAGFPHFRDKTRALAEIHRILKLGGKVFICHTSSRASINQMHSHIPEVADDLIPDEDQMGRLLSSSGFSQISIEDEESSYLATGAK